MKIKKKRSRLNIYDSKFTIKVPNVHLPHIQAIPNHLQSHIDIDSEQTPMERL